MQPTGLIEPVGACLLRTYKGCVQGRIIQYVPTISIDTHVVFPLAETHACLQQRHHLPVVPRCIAAIQQTRKTCYGIHTVCLCQNRRLTPLLFVVLSTPLALSIMYVCVRFYRRYIAQYILNIYIYIIAGGG